jgi:hypothetical protein
VRDRALRPSASDAARAPLTTVPPGAPPGEWVTVFVPTGAQLTVSLVGGGADATPPLARS